MRYKDTTYQEYLDANIKNSLLKGILSYMCVPLGIKPDEAPLPIVAVCFAVFMDGTSYPRMGPGMFARKVARAGEYFGGKVLCGAEVTKILVTENDKAYGVELSDGSRLTATTIISNCGYIKTFKQFLPERFHYVVKKFEPGCQHFLTFLGFKSGQDELKFPDHNIYLAKNAMHFNNRDFHNQKIVDEKVDLPSIFINFPTVFHKQDGKFIVVIAIEAKYEWFEKWKDNKDDEYKAFGDSLMNRCLERFFYMFPDSKVHLDFAKWTTPLDMERWIGSPSGSSFTTKLNFDRILDQTQKTPIENLYMTGADAFLANGITVGAISALVAAQIVSGKNLIKMVMDKKSQVA
jgi:all-trans-retinol 13,14-reductase